MEHICDYGCGKIAKYKFGNGKWCCEENMHRCIGYRNKFSKIARENAKGSNAYLMRKLASKGKRRCKYCNEIARYWLRKNIFCCTENARNCPGYGKYIGDKKKIYYKENPEYLEFQRNHIHNLANNSEIQEKKREAMLILHHGDCDKCVEYQENFKTAHENRKKTED